MHDQDWNSMDEMEFDAMLEDSVSGQPPTDIVTDVTPWRKAIKRALAGIALSAITLNFLALDYIMPAVGLILSILGFRALRRENIWFRGCWRITLIRAAIMLPLLAFNATIFQSSAQTLPVFSVLRLVTMALQVLLAFFLWRGFLAVQSKVGIKPHAGNAVALMVWYAIVCLLVLSAGAGEAGFFGLIMIIAYVCIIRSLLKLSKKLDEAGYAIQTGAVRMSDRAAAVTVLAIMIIGIVCGYLFFNRYPMDWQPVSVSGDRDLAEIKAHLIELGFPEPILNDLTDADLRDCAGADRVVVQVADHPVNSGRKVRKENNVDGINHISTYTVYDVKELHLTGIGVELPGERSQWKVIHHFLWTADPGFYGTESIQLWPSYGARLQGWTSDGTFTGRVLYDREGQTFSAPYYSLGYETFTSNSIFWGQRTSTDMFAAFSMPGNGENHRGYVAYTLKETEEGWMLDSWMNYTHQMTWLQYPVVTAKEMRMSVGVNNAGAFRTIQDALQVYPYESTEY